MGTYDETHKINLVTEATDAPQKRGAVIRCSGSGLILTKVTKNSICTATTCYVYNGSGTASFLSSGSFVGNDYTCSHALTAGNFYTCLADNNTAAYKLRYSNTITTYPMSGSCYSPAKIEWWRGYNGSAEVTNMQNIAGVTLEDAATGTNFKVNIGDAYKTVDSLKINIGDSWKTVTGAKINIGDSWKTIF